MGREGGGEGKEAAPAQPRPPRGRSLLPTHGTRAASSRRARGPRPSPFRAGPAPPPPPPGRPYLCVEHDGAHDARLPHGQPQVVQRLLVIVVGAVGEVEAGHVHAAPQHLAQRGHAAGGAGRGSGGGGGGWFRSKMRCWGVGAAAEGLRARLEEGGRRVWRVESRWEVGGEQGGEARRWRRRKVNRCGGGGGGGRAGRRQQRRLPCRLNALHSLAADWAQGADDLQHGAAAGEGGTVRGGAAGQGLTRG